MNLKNTIKSSKEEITKNDEKYISFRTEELKNIEKEVEIEKKQLENKGLEQDISERKRYAGLIFIFLAAFLLLSLNIIFLSAININRVHYIEISEKVLITLLATTCVEVIGIFLVVVRYLFPK